MKDYHSGDAKKRENAITQAMKQLEGLVKVIIRRNYSTYSKKYYRDLMQEGNIGIMEGLKKYDAEISMPATFFYRYIVHEIQQFITKNVDKTTAHYSTNIKKINKAIDDLTERGINWTIPDIAMQTGLTIETVEQSMSIRKRRDEVHIEACQTNVIDEGILNDRFQTPESAIVEQEEEEIIDSVLRKYLTPVEFFIIENSFGLHDKSVMSERDIAKKLDIGKDKVKKILNSAIRKLRSSELRLFFQDNLSHVEKSLNDYEVSYADSDVADLMTEQLNNLDINF